MELADWNWIWRSIPVCGQRVFARRWWSPPASSWGSHTGAAGATQLPAPLCWRASCWRGRRAEGGALVACLRLLNQRRGRGAICPRLGRWPADAHSALN